MFVLIFVALSTVPGIEQLSINIYWEKTWICRHGMDLRKTGNCLLFTCWCLKFIMTTPGLKRDTSNTQDSIGHVDWRKDINITLVLGEICDEADLLKYGQWQIWAREVPREEGKIFLWTDIWVTSTKGHKRIRRLTLRQRYQGNISCKDGCDKGQKR